MAAHQSITHGRSTKAAAAVALILLKATLVAVDLDDGGTGITVVFNGPVLSGGEVVR
ncbi:hypothetical protein OSH11_11740 [Kaistia dalseonensis]|uniref:Uncharacterized protein n=1 Tax=Kaistia dalseonensis TaxID=410840 RepID=A0ABU0H8Z5_9HYPH|nr:hypothetical protein [Kaistia dalseonensis]MCX5495382.1 hypothetical protein [Kaistia dalseonensis]MDQ0437969.1 hypothetical protein [Kaistia dalseonensis]